MRARDTASQAKKPRKAKKAEAPKRKPGRPTIYSDAVASAICQRIMAGESLKKICEDPNMPAQSTVFDWLLRKPDFAESYAQAREAQADHFVDEMQEIADASGLDVSFDENTGKWKLDGEVVNRSRLRVETRARLAELLSPRKYGKKHLEVSGELHHYHHMPHHELLEKVEGQMRDLGILVEHDPA